MVETEYSVKDVARIFELQEARLRYWAQTGFVGPSVRRRGRGFYTFKDLIGVRLAKELLDKGLTLQRVRRNLDALRTSLPKVDRPLSELRVCTDGDHLVVVDENIPFEPDSGQVVMNFAVASLSSQLADVHPIGTASNGGNEDQTAYKWFLDGGEAEAAGDPVTAETCYRNALQADGAIAAAHTNLGNVLYADRRTDEARGCYEQALELDPEQPEARFNLGNLLDDVGETELAIAELRQVCSRCPEFADAHYNLAGILARVGGVAQARNHFERYLALDPDSEWANRARERLEALS